MRAEFSAASGKVTLRTEDAALVLRDLDSGFFDGLAIEEDTYGASLDSARLDSELARRGFGELMRAYRRVFAGEYRGFGSAAVASMRAQLAEESTSAPGDLAALDAQLERFLATLGRLIPEGEVRGLRLDESA